MTSIVDIDPAEITECETNCINGNCGVDCHVFQIGACEWDEDGPRLLEKEEDELSLNELAWQKWGF